MNETPVNKVLEYGKILYETGRYNESREILSDFIKIFPEKKKILLFTSCSMDGTFDKFYHKKLEWS